MQSSQECRSDAVETHAWNRCFGDRPLLVTAKEQECRTNSSQGATDRQGNDNISLFTHAGIPCGFFVKTSRLQLIAKLCLGENDIDNEMRRGLPEVGEKVRTPDGTAKVVDTSVLEGKVKVRLFVEESKQDPDTEDKLSSDIYTYSKEDIRRFERRGKKRQEDLFQGVNAEELKELGKLIQD